MNKILSYCLFLMALLTSNTSFSQNWTWKTGANTVDDLAVYGTMGIEAPANKPGGRREFVTWKDVNGIMWLFGGYGRTVSSTVGSLNDLWKFNPINNQWTWVSGTNLRNQLGTYGVLQTPAAGNKPGARRFATGWADNAGNLWLFGGTGYAASGAAGRLNDLWKYNTTTNEWTWMSGSNAINQLGDYTTIGALRPGARTKSVSWTDGTDGWIFGGDGYNSSLLGQLNDLWKFNISTNTWTFVKGDNALYVAGVYGTIGTSDPANKPGARELSSTWFDAGNLYLFGGGTGSTQLFADLWKYNITSGDWTWIKGTNVINAPGVYGPILNIQSTNYPGSRQYATTFKDQQNRAFIVGGFGYSSSDNGSLNDVWCYRPIDNTWTWTKGSNVAEAVGSYGTINVSSSSNVVGARYGAGGWMSASDNIILFGGYGNSTTTSAGYLNDVWGYSSAAILPITLKTFSAHQQGDQIDINWTTSSEINNDHFEILHSIDGEHFDVLGKVNSRGNSSMDISYVYTHGYPNLTLTNYYQLKQVDIDGKSSLSEIVKVDNDKTSSLEFNVSTNAYQQLLITCNSTAYSLKLYDVNGRCVKNVSQLSQTSSLDISNLAKGIYIVQVLSKNQVKSERISIQ